MPSWRDPNAQVPWFSYGGWARRHPAAADTLERAVWYFAPWALMAAGSYLLYRAPRLDKAKTLNYPYSVQFALLVGLLSVTMASLMVSDRLFASRSPGSRSFSRPVFQMVIATLVAEALAIGLAAVGLYAGESVNALDTTRALFDTRTLAIAAGLFVVQGLAFPLYAWWKWSGERKH